MSDQAGEAPRFDDDGPVRRAAPEHGMSDGLSAPPPQLADNRGPSHGLGRIVMAAFWVAGVACIGVGLFQLFADPTPPFGSRLVTVFAGLIYVGAAVGLTHNGRRMRKVAWTCISVSLAGPVIVGLLGVGSQQSSPLWSPWEGFGIEAWFFSLVLPIVGFVWMWWSNPRRIVELAEGMDKVSRRGV